MPLESEVPGPGVDRPDGRQVAEGVAKPNLAMRCHRVKRSHTKLPRSLEVILVRPVQSEFASMTPSEPKNVPFAAKEKRPNSASLFEVGQGW